MKKFVFFLNLTAIATFFVLFFSTGTHADCTKDIDCKGNRICEKGICVDPGQTEQSVEKKKVVEDKKGPRETGRDGRFIAYADGTVLDTQTNLMWAAKDNGYGINWYDAKKYCENYRGGGYTDWWMPTADVLAGLYDPNKSRPVVCERNRYIHVATELIDITCVGTWIPEMNGDYADIFYFSDGKRYAGEKSLGRYLALPVRSVK
jgi:hypothetical protein